MPIFSGILLYLLFSWTWVRGWWVGGTVECHLDNRDCYGWDIVATHVPVRDIGLDGLGVGSSGLVDSYSPSVLALSQTAFN